MPDQFTALLRQKTPAYYSVWSIFTHNIFIKKQIICFLLFAKCITRTWHNRSYVHMRALQLAAVCLFVTAVIVSGIGTAQDVDDARGEPEIEAYAPETAFVPGEEASLDVTFNNRGDLSDRGSENLETDVITAQSATARIVTDDETADDVPFDVRTGEQPVGDIGEGTTGPVSFTVVPDADAEPGVYEVPIELEYRHAYNSEVEDGATIQDERDETEIVYVEVEITDRAQFAVVDINSTVQAGASGLVNVTMRNVADGVARKADVTATPVDGDISFSTDSGTTDTFVDRWAPGENRTFTYRMDAAADSTERPSTFELDVAYRDNESADATARTVRTGITPLAEQSFGARGIHSSLQIGEDGHFTAEVTNDGPVPARDVIVVFDNEAPAVEGVTEEAVPTDPNVVPRETQATVGTLAVGESATVTLEAGIRTDALAGNRTLNLATRYRTADGDVTVSDPLDIVVPVAAEQDVFAVSPATPNATVPSNATPGDTVRYHVVVRNTGDERVEDVQAKLFANDPLDATDDEAFVTALEPNESTTLRFEVEIDSSASTKTYATSIDLRYLDEDGDEQLTDTYRLPVDVVESTDPGLLESILTVLTTDRRSIILLSVGVLAIAAVYTRGRIVAAATRSREWLQRRFR